MIVYDAVEKSLYKACKDFAAANSWTTTIYNFDAYSEKNDLPEGDLIGLNGYTLDADTDLITVRCRIGIATQHDQNLFRLSAMAGKLFQSFRPGHRIDVFDPEAPSTKVGSLLIAAGTSISPVYQAVQKPLKFLAFTAHSDLVLTQ